VFKQSSPLLLPGFGCLCAIGAPRFDAPAFVVCDEGRDVVRWYETFRDRVADASARGQYFPVYRLGDGEFSVLVGHQESFLRRLRRIIIRLAKGRPAHRSGTPMYGFEEYSSAELAEVRRRLPEMLRLIAQTGVLAAALHPRNPGFSPYILPFLRYVHAHSIPFNSDSYVPFYFVYALLCGPDNRELFQGRRILVITSNSHEKFARLRNRLGAFGAASIEFLECSSGKAMFDVLPLDNVRAKPNLVLVGAGIGAANVLTQLRELKAPCIDAGYALTVLGDPRTPRRAYSMSDDEWDSGLLADVPEDLAAGIRGS
jgi:hypothetical protein